MAIRLNQKINLFSGFGSDFSVFGTDFIGLRKSLLAVVSRF